MSALKWIVSEAKKLKKEYPKRYTKWTDYVKQASAIYASKHKGVSPVGKKKAAPKKVGAVKKKAAPKKVAKKKAPKKLKYAGTLKAQDGKRMYKYSLGKKPVSTHKDTKSHNVQIKVVSGTKKIGAWYDHKPFTLTDLKKIHKDFFAKGYETYFHIKKKKIVVSKKLESQVYLEKQNIPYLGISYTARKVHPDGSFGDTKRFSHISDLESYIDKHITF